MGALKRQQVRRGKHRDQQQRLKVKDNDGRPHASEAKTKGKASRTCSGQRHKANLRDKIKRRKKHQGHQCNGL